MRMLTKGSFIPAILLMAISLFAVWPLLSGASGLEKSSRSRQLQILWTNDMHGYLVPLYHREPWEKDYLETAAKEGKIGAGRILPR